MILKPLLRVPSLFCAPTPAPAPDAGLAVDGAYAADPRAACPGTSSRAIFCFGTISCLSDRSVVPAVSRASCSVSVRAVSCLAPLRALGAARVPSLPSGAGCPASPELATALDSSALSAPSGVRAGSCASGVSWGLAQLWRGCPGAAEVDEESLPGTDVGAGGEGVDVDCAISAHATLWPAGTQAVKHGAHVVHILLHSVRV